MAVQGVVREVDGMTDRDAGVRAESLVRVGWLRATAPLWPLGLARILYGYLWWQQSAWKVPSDDFGRKSGVGLWYWFQQGIQHPTLTAYKDFQLHVVIPHWTFFGWMTLTDAGRSVSVDAFLRPRSTARQPRAIGSPGSSAGSSELD